MAAWWRRVRVWLAVWLLTRRRPFVLAVTCGDVLVLESVDLLTRSHVARIEAEFAGVFAASGLRVVVLERLHVAGVIREQVDAVGDGRRRETEVR